jgi:hypothetical protein
MFFQAIFALYLVAIALAAPKVAEVRGIGTSRLNSRPLYTNLSTDVEVDGNDIIKGIANDAHVI